MKGNAFFVTFCFIGFFALQSISIGYAQDRNPAGWPEQVWTMLLRPDGWIDYFSGCPHSGESMITFEARGQKVVAIIQNPGGPTCERDVMITPGIIKFDGCRDREIALHFDPNDQIYPFKGSSNHCKEYKFKAR